jgi:hypothetical protein
MKEKTLVTKDYTRLIKRQRKKGSPVCPAHALAGGPCNPLSALAYPPGPGYTRHALLFPQRFKVLPRSGMVGIDL